MWADLEIPDKKKVFAATNMAARPDEDLTSPVLEMGSRPVRPILLASPGLKSVADLLT